jgi:OOP family OmpA-OmpF porin
MKVLFRFVVVGAALSLGACFNNDHIDIANMSPAGTQFQAELHQGYSELSKLEYDEGDWSDGFTFSTKARKAAEGEEVPPELVWDWDVPEETEDELYQAHDTLGYWMRMGAAERVPGLMANAQVAFDCWIQEQEENYQSDDIARCRDDFYTAIQAIENTMTWQADVEEPMFMPAPPEPAAATAAPPEGRPRFYTIFFDWDMDDITPVAQRVVDTIAEDWLTEQSTLNLVGHTDRSGSDDYNQNLSEQRVDAVTESLVIEGFGPARISGYGVGETDPIVPTADGEREQRNRRVVVTVAE